MNKFTDQTVPVSFNKSLQAVICPGIEVAGITGMVVSPPRNKDQLVFEQYQFTPFFSNESTLKDALWKITDIVKNNSHVNKLNVIEICKNPSASVAELLYEGADKTATAAVRSAPIVRSFWSCSEILKLYFYLFAAKNYFDYT